MEARRHILSGPGSKIAMIKPRKLWIPVLLQGQHLPKNRLSERQLRSLSAKKDARFFAGILLTAYMLSLSLVVGDTFRLGCAGLLGCEGQHHQ